jgi:hypothetical protein
MNIIFQISGGIGKCVMATAVCEAIKKQYPDSRLIVVSGYADVFLNNPVGGHWVLYPDHAVFLGPKAFVYDGWEDFFSQESVCKAQPDLIFIKNVGVFASLNFSLAKTVQLRCYYDVMSRVLDTAVLNPLNELEIASLLNWDAEKLRQKM